MKNLCYLLLGLCNALPLFSFAQRVELGVKANDQYSGVNFQLLTHHGIAGEFTAAINRKGEGRGTVQFQKFRSLRFISRSRDNNWSWFYGAAIRISNSKVLHEQVLNYGLDAVVGAKIKSKVLPVSFSTEYLPGYSKNSMKSGLEFQNWALSCRYVFQ